MVGTLYLVLGGGVVRKALEKREEEGEGEEEE